MAGLAWSYSILAGILRPSLPHSSVRVTESTYRTDLDQNITEMKEYFKYLAGLLEELVDDILVGDFFLSSTSQSINIYVLY